MKTSIMLLCTAVTVLLLSACGEERTENSNTKNANMAMGNPVDTYMDGRVSAMDMAKQSVKESNKKVEEQDKAMKALLGK